MPASDMDRVRLGRLLSIQHKCTIASFVAAEPQPGDNPERRGAMSAPLFVLPQCCPRYARFGFEFRPDWEDRRMRWAPVYDVTDPTKITEAWECATCGNGVGMNILGLIAHLQVPSCGEHGSCTLMFCRVQLRYFWVCLSLEYFDVDDTPIFLEDCVYEQVDIPGHLQDQYGEQALLRKLQIQTPSSSQEAGLVIDVTTPPDVDMQELSDGDSDVVAFRDTCVALDKDAIEADPERAADMAFLSHVACTVGSDFDTLCNIASA